MNESVYDKIYERFRNITGYDIKIFLQDFIDFVNNHYANIVSYYNGGAINNQSFGMLDRLLKEINKIEPLFTLHYNSLNNIGDWFLLDLFSQVQTKLWTIRFSSKWMRSVRTGVRSNTIKYDKFLKTDQNFEDIAAEVGMIDYQNDWKNITVPQYITEESYTPQSSPIFSVNFQISGINYIDNIVDSLEGKNVLGKDISTDFSFEGDDLKVVLYEDSLKQALQLILESEKGAIPEFNDYGIPSDFRGTTVNAIQYSIIFKSIMNMFQRDSRWRSVELMDIYRDQDSIFIKIKATAVTAGDFVLTVPI